MAQIIQGTCSTEFMLLYFAFISGWVRTVLYHDIGNDNCNLTAKVTPSQRVSEKPHEAWVALNKTTCAVVTGHCTCMAGYVNVCSSL